MVSLCQIVAFTKKSIHISMNALLCFLCQEHLIRRSCSNVEIFPYEYHGKGVKLAVLVLDLLNSREFGKN